MLYNSDDNITGFILKTKKAYTFFPVLRHVPGSQQRPGAAGGQGHGVRPPVAPALALQLPQVPAQDAAEFPAPGLGDADGAQREGLLHRPQQPQHHLGETRVAVVVVVVVDVDVEGCDPPLALEPQVVRVFDCQTQRLWAGTPVPTVFALRILERDDPNSSPAH